MKYPALQIQLHFYQPLLLNGLGLFNLLKKLFAMNYIKYPELIQETHAFQSSSPMKWDQFNKKISLLEIAWNIRFTHKNYVCQPHTPQTDVDGGKGIYLQCLDLHRKVMFCQKSTPPWSGDWQLIFPKLFCKHWMKC